MPSSLLLRRAIHASFPFFTGALALACGGVAPSPPTETPALTFEGRHVYELDVAARSNNVFCPVQGSAATLHLGMELDAQDIAAQGWIALESVELAQGTPPAFMVDSESMAGTIEGGRATFDTVQFRVGQGLLRFEGLKLAPAGGGEIEGTANGYWQATDSNLKCLASFAATFTGAPDVAPPSVKLAAPGSALHLPFEALDVLADEPIVLAKTTFEVRAGDVPVPAKLTFGAGNHPGIAGAFAVAPAAFFPAGESLSISMSIADAAGNSSDIALGPVEIVPQGEAFKNLGFEDGLKGWYADPPWNPAGLSAVDARSSYPTYTDYGEAFDVQPVEGSMLASIESGGRLMGYLAPPAGATQLHLRAAVVHTPGLDPANFGTGLSIEVIAEGAPVVKQDGHALLGKDPKANWTGWGTVTVDLPKEAASGFWLQVQPAPIPSGSGLQTTVLLDALSFE